MEEESQKGMRQGSQGSLEKLDHKLGSYYSRQKFTAPTQPAITEESGESSYFNKPKVRLGARKSSEPTFVQSPYSHMPLLARKQPNQKRIILKPTLS